MKEERVIEIVGHVEMVRHEPIGYEKVLRSVTASGHIREEVDLEITLEDGSKAMVSLYDCEINVRGPVSRPLVIME